MTVVGNGNSLIKHKKKLKEHAEKLFNRLGFNINIPLDLDILAKIQEKLDYQLIVVDFRTGSLPFTGIKKEKKIYLLYSRYAANGHYDYIKSITGFFNRKYYCLDCNIAYQKPINHRCPDSCFLCRGVPKCVTDDEIKCDQCCLTFANSDCYHRHIEIKICKYRRFCDLCEAIYIVKKSHEHECGKWKCFKCKEYYTKQPHFCYIQPLQPQALAEDDKIERIFVAFDVESMLIKSPNNVTEHIPILICAAITCDNCWKLNDNWMSDSCPHCLSAKMSWYGRDCVARFNNYVLNVLANKAAKNKWQVLVAAHNLSNYDGHFILRDLMEREIKNIVPIMKGNKILKLDIANVRYIDSLLFFLQPLAALPKCFGLQSTAKGFFPHFKNTPENQDKEWILGDITLDEFGVKSMKESTAEELKAWRTLNKDMTYNLKQQMVKYCENDVKILLQSLMKFRQLFKQETKIDPLKRCFTLASVALEYFRATHLEENKIGVTPIQGYESTRLQSFEGKAFLDYYASYYNKTISREYREGPYWFDGCIDEPTEDPIDGSTQNKIVFEFLGKIFLYRYSFNAYYNRYILI